MEKRQHMDQPNVLIISDDPDFSSKIVSRWQNERGLPAFSLIGSSDPQDSLDHHIMTILGPMPSGQMPSVLAALNHDPVVQPILCVSADPEAIQAVRDKFPAALLLPQKEGWLDAVVLICAEAIRRVAALNKLRQTEEAAAVAERNAILGRYIVEMRHSIANALTSVLGNAELLLLEPGALSTEVRDQIGIIHSMALRIHEVMQRFSSLDAELQIAARQAQEEIRQHPNDLVPS
jgi:signal transduction histidine kinase